MKARVKLVEGMTFVAESGSGHAVVMDASPEVGGRDMGARPMEMVLMGAGGCSAIDVVHILRKARQNLVDCVEAGIFALTRPRHVTMATIVIDSDTGGMFG